MVEVSVIIPCFNAARFVDTAIESVLGQTSVKQELVVVDDGSTDGSLEVLSRYGRKIRLISQTNCGAAHARNTGFKVSAAPYVKFLDADDYLLPNALSYQLKHAMSLPKKGFSYGRMFRLDQSTGNTVPHSKRDYLKNNCDSLENLVQDPPVTASLLFTREQLTTLRCFDERFALRDDFDLFVRSLISGFLPVACPQDIYVYRDHPSEDRLSRRASDHDYTMLIEMFAGHRDKIEVSETCPSGLPRALGKAAWTTARNALRAGRHKHARKLFDLAQEIAGSRVMTGSQVYKVLTHAIGPFASEAVFERLKSFRKP